MLSTSLLERNEGYLCKRMTRKGEVMKLIESFLDREGLELALTIDWIGMDEAEKVPYYILHIKGYGMELERYKESAEILV